MQADAGANDRWKHVRATVVEGELDVAMHALDDALGDVDHVVFLERRNPTWPPPRPPLRPRFCKTTAGARPARAHE
eukprot:12684590-Alexandrium_andersonii.AAC.1